MAKWNIDPIHSSVEFSVRHLGVAWVRGRFLKFEGSADFDPEHPERGSIEAKIEASSISTGDDKRDGHLKSPDFFDVEKYPYVIFKSTKVEKANGNKYKVTGDLTIRDVTKPAVLDVEFFGAREIPTGEGTSDTKAGFSAKTTINRHDFGISWDMPAGEEATTVGGEVDVTINIEAVKQ